MAVQQVDSLRTILDSVFQAPAYNWVPDRDPFALLRRGWAFFINWLHELAQASPLSFRLLIYGTILAVVLILGRTLWVMFRTVHAPPGSQGTPGPAEAPIRDVAWYRAASARHVAAGRYAEAMEADFWQLLIALEQRSILTIQPSTTPAEYARSVRLDPTRAAAFQEMVRRLYGYLFARWPCGADEYAAWQMTVDPDRYAPAH